MSTDGPSDGLQEIATRFAALWRALSHDGEAVREASETRLLVDRVRDALDRRRERLDNADPFFVANSFVIEAQVYDGELAQIHRARHRDLRTLHALKTLHPDQVDNVVARELLLREARFGTRLRHKHIAAADMALRLPDGRPALVLEWLPASLADRLETGLLSPGEVQEAVTAMLHGLEAIHAAGLVHADIAPGNLLLAGDNLAALKIADFGITLETGQRHADLDLRTAGRAAFAAPEQMAGQALDGRADLYACGRIMHLLLERCVQGGASVDHLAGLARRLTELDPDERPSDAMAALALLA